MPPGSTLIAYTDGLVEQPGRDLDEGIGGAGPPARDDAPVDATPQVLCDTAAGPGRLDRRDDVALIAVRFG